MNPDPLSGLRDWHLPDPVSWWPPAPGWWLLAGLLLAGVWFASRWWRRWPRQGAGTRLALRELAGLNAALVTDGDARRFVAGVSQLLRRLALVRFPREQVAGLSGSDWLTFLDATGGGTGFTQGPGRILTESAYRPEVVHTAGFDPEPLSRLAAGWIRTNQGKTRP